MNNFDASYKGGYMKIDTTYIGVKSTESMRKYVERKLKKLENLLEYDTNVAITVNMNKKKDKKQDKDIIVSVEVNATNCKERYHVLEENSDFYTAIDKLEEKLKRKIIKKKEKIQSLKRRKGINSNIEEFNIVMSA